MPLVQRLDPLLSPFFEAVTFPEAKVAELRDLARKGPLVYVMRSAGALNYAYFSHAYARRGLPVPRLVHGFGDGVLSKLSGVKVGTARELADAVDQGESALLFLRKPDIFGARRGAAPEEDAFAALLRLCREHDRRLFLVPQVLVWERHPGKLKPGLASFFMGTPDSPNPWRTAGAFLYNFRHAMAKVGTPIDLLHFSREQGEVSVTAVARKVRGALWQHLAHEARVVTGPQLKGTGRIVEEVLRDRVLRSTLDALVAEGQGSAAELNLRAHADIEEIAAAYSPTAVEVIRPTLDLIVNRIYDGIELDSVGLERIKQAAARSAVILCPSHKSHVDYLILSKILYDAGMTPPHIAAGANLSFFPLGPVFRSAGAFFLRRSFKGDKVYAATFRAYVKRLMKDGFTQEFFIEGSRSRTGKLLSPKLGLLSMEVDAWVEGASHDVQFIPIAIDYERIVEGSAFAKEMAGGEKQKEDFGGLLRTPKVLTSRYGRIYLQVDEPVSLKEFFAERGVDPQQHTDDERRELVQVLAHRIVYGIARAATITPAALVAAAVLAHRRRGLSRLDVTDRIQFLRTLCERIGARLSRVLTEGSGDPGVAGPIREATLLLTKDGCLKELPASGEIYLVAEESRRLQLSFYKNNLLHPLVPASLLATALLSFRAGAPNVKDLGPRVLWLSRLFKYEFVYRVGSSFQQIFEETLALCQKLGLVELQHAVVRPTSVSGRERLELLRDLTHDFLESYFLAADAVHELMAVPELEAKDLTKRALARGQAAYLAGRINGLESLSKPNFDNAWLSLRDAGLIRGEQKLSLSDAVRGDTKRIAKLREEIAQYL